MNEIVFGFLLMYGPVALLAGMIWATVWWWHKKLTARDVMALFRANRERVAAREDRIVSLHDDIQVAGPSI